VNVAPSLCMYLVDYSVAGCRLQIVLGILVLISTAVLMTFAGKFFSLSLLVRRVL